ncbi:hypothetical protein M5G22_09745 [Pseudomonas sp. TNT2022 ID233]|uniref:hypothetical protein n=1 Tax=Pseudomonas aphyarum TaxID=2942629 RepID=UPI00235E8551|nr:hypothetical protein [Pseudomonas aphyarum]MDD1137832.1 hypothetical protein [Pseudomonas aphyarum]
MEIALIVMFLLVWAGMWAWVVKNRGTWPAPFGHFAGVIAGFIVAAVVYVTVSGLLPEKPTPATSSGAQPQIANESQLRTFVPRKPVSRTSAATSPLLPTDSPRYPRLSTPLLSASLDPQWRNQYAQWRAGADMVNGTNGGLAGLICRSAAKSTLRVPDSAAFDETDEFRSDAYKSQTYLLISRISGENMEGTMVSLGYDCAVQFVSGNGVKDDQWRLLELTMRGKSGPAVSTSTSTGEALPEYVAGEPGITPEPLKSGLVENYLNEIPTTRSELATVQGMTAQQTLAHAQLRKGIVDGPDANKRLIAFQMCEPFIRSALRQPELALFADDKALSTLRYKHQIYTSTSLMKIQDAAGNYLTYRFECTLQAMPTMNAGFDDWKLLDLRFELTGS